MSPTDRGWIAGFASLRLWRRRWLLWRDPASWSIGLAVGVAAGVIAALRQRRQ